MKSISVFCFVSAMKVLILLILFFAKAKSFTINCEFIDGINWVIIGVVYTCKVSSVSDLENNPTHVTKIIGKHLPDHTNEYVKAIDIGWLENPLTIPQGLLEFFPNLISIERREYKIKPLIGDELHDYKNLEFFVFASTDTTFLPGNLFSENPKIKFLDFSFDKIKHVGENILDNLSELEMANFSGNVCIGEWIQDHKDVPKLIELLKKNCPEQKDEDWPENELYQFLVMF